MRSFLPIKGPGGRYLTSREKVALLVLGLTLVVCALTLLAGSDAYVDEPGRNPVSAFVAALCRTFGGGVVALYGIVLVWSGLIYFKGEKVVDVAPIGGRAFAAIAVAIGLSGALGIGQLDSAGRLGLVVGGALYNTCGDVMGFVFMFALMGIGLNLAGQGAWTALREPMPAGAGGAPGTAPGHGFGIDAPEGRQVVPPMPDDGDPSSDERSMAVTQAMEEIERSQGVTIVELREQPRPSIGEEVDEAPPPAPETDEAEVQRVVEDIAESLGGATIHEDEDEVAEEREEEVDPPETDEVHEVEPYEHSAHGFVPVPPAADTAVEDEEAEADEYEEEDDETEEAEADEEYEEEDDETEEAEADEEYEEEDDETEEAEADEEAEYEDEVAEEDEYEEEEDDGETGEAAEDEEYEYEYEEVDAEDDGEEYEEAEDEAPAERAPTFWEEGEDDDETAPVDEEREPVPVAADDARDEGVREIGVAQADGYGDAEDAEDAEEDPYAQGGLVRRIRKDPAPSDQPDDEEPSPYTSFDWRGRPLE